jgi:DNA integrity scanning protein DisA with diadenylate cyclase activity
MEGFDFSFLNLRFLDLLDILLVALIIYYVYNLIRGTIALNILLGLFIIYAVYVLVKQAQMRLLTELLGAFVSVGFIALIVVSFALTSLDSATRLLRYNIEEIADSIDSKFISSILGNRYISSLLACLSIAFFAFLKIEVNGQ